MKIAKILAFEQVYPKLKNLPLNVKTSFTLSKIISTISPQFSLVLPNWFYLLYR